MRNFVVLVGIWLIAAPVFAVETQKLYRSAEFLGRGYTGITDPTDEDAIFYNPAALYSPENPQKSEAATAAPGPTPTTESPEAEGEKSEAVVSTAADAAAGKSSIRKAVILSPLFTVSSNIQELTGASGDAETLDAVRNLVGEPVHAGFDNFSGVILDNMAFGLLANYHLNVLVYKNPSEGAIETVNIRGFQNTGFTGSYAYPLQESIVIGTTLKLIQRKMTYADITIADVEAIKDFKPSKYENTGTGYGLDLGVLVKVDHSLRPRLGLSISDLGDTAFGGSDGDKRPVEPLYQTVNLGTSINPETPYVTTRLFFDIRDILSRAEENFLKRFHIGSDFIYDKFTGLCLGLNQGFLTTSWFYLNQYFRFDIGSYAEEVSERVGERPSRRYFFRLMSTL